METPFDQNLVNPQQPVIKPTNDQIVNEINEINEKDYLKKVKPKNSKKLIKLDLLERERVGKHIADLYRKAKIKHDELCDRLDEYDEIYRMDPITLPDDDGENTRYRSPLSTVSLEVIHANIMNVFFTPANTLRIIPTENNDIPKVKKLDIFGNWSMKNEMELEDKCERLFHASGKNGECPYAVYWKKEYGTEIKIEPIMNPANPSEPLMDEDTGDVVTQEREVSKILYNGPVLDIFSRKDYILPENAMADRLADWEMRRIRLSADKVNRSVLECRYYDGVFDEIGGWGEATIDSTNNATKDKDAKEVPLGETEKIFVEFYGKLRINLILDDNQDKDKYQELEDEFIAVVEIKSDTPCSLKKNRFPLKMRPIGMDVLIPDDEGRIGGMGVMERMYSTQKTYDILQNQYMFGVIQANNPFGFFTPTGNMRDEPIKAKSGYLYPTSDPSSVNMVKLPPPDQSLANMLEYMRNYAQLLFGIGDYQAGLESQIDPSAPAKKAEIVVAQGNVRLNSLIKRKNRTLKDIFKRWFLLYQANMPPNKFMRIAGDDKNSPWKFDAVDITDFALNSIPDFELTGNILNSNKTLEIQKALGIYNTLIANPFFAPNTSQGLQSLHALTKWLLDKFDELGLSNFLPSVPGEDVLTPQEENAMFLQGDDRDPQEGEDHVFHLRIHANMAVDQTVPDDIRKKVLDHMHKTTDMLKKQINTQMVIDSTPNVKNMGGQNGQAGPGVNQGQAGAPQNIVPIRGMGGPQGGNPAMPG